MVHVGELVVMAEASKVALETEAAAAVEMVAAAMATGVLERAPVQVDVTVSAHRNPPHPSRSQLHPSRSQSHLSRNQRRLSQPGVAQAISAVVPMATTALE